MIDYELWDDYVKRLEDRMTPYELAEWLIEEFDLETSDVIEAFYDFVERSPSLMNEVGVVLDDDA